MLCYDETYNTISRLPDTLFEQIAQLVFEQTIVLERINTRNVLSDVEGIQPLLQAVIDCSTQAKGNDDASGQNDDQSGHNPPNAQSNDSVGRQTDNANNEGSLSATVQNQPSTDGTRYAHSSPISNPQNGNRPDLPQPGGPRPGGPSPRTFFETIDWHRLNPSDSDHQGLLFAIDELYKLSTKDCERQKAYKKFPIATGMVLRTVYEQALRLRLKQVRLWGTYLQQQNGRLPMLSSIETFINQQNNKNAVFPEHDMILVFDRVIAAGHREFLNENIHYPGNINVTAESLESIAAGGMFRLIQWILEKTN